MASLPRTVHNWNAIISNHAKNGQGKEALHFYHEMLRRGFTPDKGTYLSALKSCTSIKDLTHGKVVHEHISKRKLECDVVIGSSLIDMYVKCGRVDVAHSIFDKLEHRNVVSWSAIILGYVNCGQGLVALALFEKMKAEGIRPDRVVYLCILKACCGLDVVSYGRCIHHQIMVNRFECDVALGSSLVDFYAKCGSLVEARNVFESLQDRNVVTWSSLITGYANNEEDMMVFELFERMQMHSVKPGRVAFLSILKVCGNMNDIRRGRLVHDHVVKGSLDADLSLRSTLIDMYGKCGGLSEARNVFDASSQNTVFSYGAMMTGYAQHDQGLLALDLFERMQKQGIKPDRVIFIAVLISCANTRALDQGKLIHYELIGSTLELDVSVGTALIDMYVKCGSVVEAWEVFKKFRVRDKVMWGTLLNGFLEHGQEHLVFQLFREMKQDGIEPDIPVFLCLLRTCASLRATMEGRLVHKQIITSGLNSDIAIRAGLVDMYAKSASMDDAQNVFNAAFQQNVVPWGAMIAGHAQHSQGFLALELYGKMLQEGLSPEDATFVCALKACCSAGALEQGKLIHVQVVERGLQSDRVIGNTLVDLYGKCSRPKEAQKVFNTLSDQDLVSWGALIAGYAKDGNHGLVKQCLNDMKEKKVKPDGVVFTSVLSAFSHGGLIEEGRHCLAAMTREFGIRPGVEHYNCIIDILGRSGRLKEARSFIDGMPISPNIISWMSLLAGCRTYGDMDLALWCVDEIVKLDPDKASSYVMMTGMYADVHKWDEVQKLHDMKKCASAWKEPGKAWIEIKHKVHEFFVGDRDRALSSEMYHKLSRLGKIATGEGSIPQISLITMAGI